MSDGSKAALLQLLGVGKKNAVTAKVLSDALGLEDGITSEDLRLNLIKSMIEENHIPIGSCSKGYFIIETKEEFDGVWNDLSRRIRGMKNRQGGLAKGFNKFKGQKPKVKDLRKK